MFRIGGFEKLTFFETTKFHYSKFEKKNYFSHSYLNVSKIFGYHGLDSIFMITLISSKKLGGSNNMRHPVLKSSNPAAELCLKLMLRSGKQELQDVPPKSMKLGYCIKVSRHVSYRL